MIRTRIVGTGKFLPEKVLTNKDLEEFCDTSDEWIRKRTGIEQRHAAEKGVGASDLGAPAAQMALDDAGLNAEDLDAIICATVTPDQIIPGTANLIQMKLGAKNASAFDLNAACSGFVYGLSVADSFIRSGMYKNILLVGAETATGFLTWKYRDTAVLFADGAGAVVLRGEEGDSGVLTTYLGSDGASHEILNIPTGGFKDPITHENIDNDPLRIHMDGPALFKMAVKTFPKAAKVALDAVGMTIDDVSLFIPHQANARIIEAAGQRMGLDPSKAYVNIDKVGNTVAASIPIALHEAKEAGRINEGDIILLAAFGAGITWASAIIRW